MKVLYKGFFNRDATKEERQGQKTTPYFLPSFNKEVPVVSRILLPLKLQLKKAQMCLSHVVLKRWASLWRRCGEFCEMILAYILTKSNWRMNWREIWTWGTCGSKRTASQATQRMSIQFIENQVWRRYYLTKWSSRSCDLTPLNYFLWGYVQSMVYANKPPTIDELRTNIEREIAAVSADLCLKSSKIAFNVWTSASVTATTGVERTFTGLKNFIDIQKRFCFI